MPSCRRGSRSRSREARIRMSDARLWLAGLVALPALVIGASFLRLDVERLRRLAVASAVAMLLAALVIAVSPRLRALSIRTSALSWVPGGEAIIRIDTLSAVLLPFAAGLWLLTVAVTPRAALDRGGLRRTALATLITLGILSHRERGRAPALVGGLRLDVPVRAGGPGASVSAPHRGGVSGLLDAALWRRGRAAHRVRARRTRRSKRRACG